MTIFPDSAAESYDEKCPVRVPGYESSRELAASLARTIIPDDAEILVSGCGTGSDLMALAEANPSWRFTAVEPSSGMMAKAEERVEEAGWRERVNFINARMEDAPRGLHSAALSFLVCHFIKGDEAKKRYLRALSDRLKAGAPLLMFDLVCDGPESTVNAAYVDWMERRGLTKSEAKGVIARINKHWGPVSEDYFRKLAEECGFHKPYRFCGFFNYRGVMFLKK